MVKRISLKSQSTVLTKALHASFEVSQKIVGEKQKKETLPIGQIFSLASEIKMCEIIHS